MAEESYRAGQTNLVALLQSLQAARELRAKALQAAADFETALAVAAPGHDGVGRSHEPPRRGRRARPGRARRAPATRRRAEDVATTAPVPVEVAAAHVGHRSPPSSAPPAPSSPRRARTGR